jgi:hypothetical protein
MHFVFWSKLGAMTEERRILIFAANLYTAKQTEGVIQYERSLC